MIWGKVVEKKSSKGPCKAYAYNCCGRNRNLCPSLSTYARQNLFVNVNGAGKSKKTHFQDPCIGSAQTKTGKNKSVETASAVAQTCRNF